MPTDRVHEPWHSFLRELDAALPGPAELHCFGGFVVAEYYGLARATADIDIVESRGADLATVARIAGRGSALHGKHKVYIDIVTVADVPDNYEERLLPMDDASFQNLRLLVFERHDLALAKLVRNSDRDRADVEAIAAGPGLDVSTLTARYHEELRPKLGRPEREDLTLQLWTDIVNDTVRRQE